MWRKENIGPEGGKGVAETEIPYPPTEDEAATSPFGFTDERWTFSSRDFENGAEVELIDDYCTMENPARVGALRIRRTEDGHYDLFVAWLGFLIPRPGEVVQREEVICRGTLHEVVDAENKIFDSKDVVKDG